MKFYFKVIIFFLIILALILVIKESMKDNKEVGIVIKDEVVDSGRKELFSLEDIQGEWISNQDSLYVMKIKDGKVTDTHASIEESKEENIFFVDNCNDLNEKDYSVFVAKTMSKSDPLCYEIDYLDDNYLAYYYYGRGNLLSFSKGSL